MIMQKMNQNFQNIEIFYVIIDEMIKHDII